MTTTPEMNPRWRLLVGPGVWSSLAVDMLAGTVITDHGDHLEVRTPSNPNFYWGNYVQVLDRDAADDAGRWLARHQELHPNAAHVAIGLPREPDPAPYAELGMTIDTEQALGRTSPPQAPVPSGYAVRRLASDSDWDGYVQLSLADKLALTEHDPVVYEAHIRARCASRRDLSSQGIGATFGAFSGNRLVGMAGVVLCSDLARYQHVEVDESHRRQGLASALVAAAGQWAAEQGMAQLVIMAEAGSAGEAVYRKLGFTDLQRLCGAFRGPQNDR